MIDSYPATSTHSGVRHKPDFFFSLYPTELRMINCSLLHSKCYKYMLKNNIRLSKSHTVFIYIYMYICIYEIKYTSKKIGMLMFKIELRHYIKC